ncbi:MAG: VWA domain-containing protein [Ignavibacteriaceae bacterium]|jgi:Ca-activated chloride channel family protein|nr:VWA domain-containing protein [Chlorobium sp.]MCW8962123.1 VWA domain-containing protein [Ignavibacteriaceae bacterium]MCW9094473.1 VWA domain-containing protein [Ignavibacteriaceae bacterium]MCW9098476.1 VWA domain-containing protein [Ignavibacteriaceae bacterium]
MFRFANPEYLNALYLIPVLVLLFWYLGRNRKKILQKFADKELHKTLFPTDSNLKRWTKFIIILLSLGCLIIAAANPQVGTKLTEVKQTGIDVFILLDVSNSMMAEDIKPSRLEKAKYQISNLINKLRGDRIGLIIFAGQAYVQIPLTTDYSAANLFLSAVDVNSVPSQGTAIASAIKLATASFDSLSTQKVIVTITDGEDHEGDIDEAVENAVSKGIKIYAIGLGSPDGVPIPIYNRNHQLTGFKKDNQGNTVLTKLDEETLKKIAVEGNGKYYRGTNYEDYLDKIYTELSQLEQTEFGVKKVTDYEDRFYYFLIPAIILLVLEFFISEKKSPLYARINKKLGLEQ